MDKQTLSNYGWLVIVTLVLAIMLALATPFGTYVGDAVVSVANGFVGSSNQAMDNDNIDSLSNRWSEKLNSGHNLSSTPNSALNPSGTIPEGAMYYTGVTGEEGESYNTGDYTGATATLTTSDEFPATVNTGDVYVYGDYEYRYNQLYGGTKWQAYTTQNGWGVRVLDTTQTTYGAILESINGKPIKNITNTFKDCTNLTTAPEIPSSVTNMKNTFFGCTALTTAPAIPSSVTDMTNTFCDCRSLTKAPEIPSSVTNMYKTFYNCTSLTGTITINANPTQWTQCLYGTKNTSVVGDTTMAASILKTKTSTTTNPTA